MNNKYVSTFDGSCSGYLSGGKKVVEGKEKKFQPEKYCNLRAFCWSAMNQDGLKSLDSDNTKLVGRPI